MTERNEHTEITDFPFRELFRESSIIFYQCRLDEHFPLIEVSSNVSEILGFDKGELLEDDTLWFSRIHPDDREQVLTSYETIEENRHSIIEFRFKHQNGGYIWLRGEVYLVVNEDTPHCLVGSSIDITEQKEAEDELRKLNQTLEQRIKERTSEVISTNKELEKQIQLRKKVEQKLNDQHQVLKLQQLAIDNLNDMVIITKAPKQRPLESKIVFINEAFKKFTGYAEDELIGRTPTFLHGSETSPEVQKRIEQKLHNHESLREEFINYKKDGSKYWVELDMAPFPANEDEYEYWVGINRDITQRKQAEQKLEESEKRYRAFVELSFDAIFELDLDGTIIHCNQRASELFGYSKEELMGMHSRELQPAQYQSFYPESISEIETTGDETWERSYRTKAGEIIPTEIHTQKSVIGGKMRLIAYVRDNSTHKKYENAIRKSLKEKETLLAEIHHRVKNNLAIISGLLQMQVFNTDDERLAGKLQESQSRIQSIAMVHEKLYESDSFSDIAIDQYIDDLLGIIINSISSEDKDISIEKDMDSISLEMSQAIPCGLLLNELITNCLKHGFRDRQEGTIYINLHRNDSEVALSVRDDGVGLPEDFDINSESSLGMTLINTLVRQLEGTLDISSQHGSSFTIRFKEN